MKQIVLAITVLGLLASCSNRVNTNKSVLSSDQALEYLNLKDLGELQALPSGKVFLEAKDIQALHPGVQGLRSGEGYLAVGQWYVPVGLYKTLEERAYPYNLSHEAVQTLQGPELQFLYKASPKAMRQWLASVGLRVSDIRSYSTDGELSLADLKMLAKKARGPLAQLVRGRLGVSQ
jgi:hypothetical protein